MDPSIIICKYKNSFDITGVVPITLHTYTTVDPTPRLSVKKVIQKRKQSQDSEISDKDITLYDKNLKDKYGKSNKNGKRDLYDPFYNVSHKPFVNRDAIVLADIDMAFNFSDHVTGYILKQDIKEFTFVTLDDGIGGFTQYLFYRNPDAYGYGISPVSGPALSDDIDMNHFNVLKGPSNKGDLRRNYKHFIDTIKKTEPFGVDIVVGNSLNNNISSNNISPTNTPIDYMVRLILSLNILMIGGTFISSINGIDNKLMLDLLYITTQCFNNVTLFKPLAEPFDIENNNYYVVAQDMKVNNLNWIEYLTRSYNSMGSVLSTGSVLSGLLGELPNDFLKWVEEYNNLMLLYNKDLVHEKQNKIYDTYRCKAIWNLPQI